ncbi:ABC1 kinase family protein [Paraconexibacter algicola]|uniref:ATP-binding protein n=1 Tax=Paraconexibacter algicola TaxID=2133960 RepID=A0A2T4UHL2_9ACTN|nr:AarF/ABC1/UbiB kinase family protein [Paraconexibacter algicola]PTL58734.1 ATP-binding protein [Paraconexibacter algicola]
MAEKEQKVPTNRYARAARVGRMAASQSVKQMGTRAANTVRSDDAARRAMERRQFEAAEQLVTVLGTMKGAAMKLGQVLSFLDVGIVPEEHREEFQAKLAALRDAAPKVAFKDMRKVIEADLGESLSAVFSDFDEEAIAAASIGQVYRARLREDGREVAVKVQYPGVNAAVRADLQNLGMIMRLISRLMPGLDTQALTQEIRERVVEELDYELEASNQKRLARIYRDHPFIVIPGVVTDLCRERVIVTEFVDGEGFEAFKARCTDEERDRLGEIVFRFYFGSMYRFLQFSGDPHPGNFLVMPDGRVCFLDFGLFKTIDRSVADVETASQRLAHEGRGEELRELWVREGFLSSEREMEVERLLDFVSMASGWYTEDEEVQLTPELASDVVLGVSTPMGEHFARFRHESMPAEYLFGRRLEHLTLAVLGQLEAKANFHRIAREWVYGDEPVTELGKLEAAWLADRHG